MVQAMTAHPIRLVSRSAARRSVVRASWFVMGVGFGVGCALCLTTTMTPMTPATWEVAHELPEISGNFVEDLAAAPEQQAPAPAPLVARPVELKDAKEEVEVAETQETSAENAAELMPAAAPAPEQQPPALAQAAEPGEALPGKSMTEYPLMVDMKVSSGDTLMNILTETGVSTEEAQDVIQCIGKVYNPKKLDVGQSVSMVLDKPEIDTRDGLVVASLSLPVSVTDTIEVTRRGEGRFSARTVKAEVETKTARAGGKINSSLYETAISSGVPAAVLGEIINAYSYDVDFQRDIHANDHVDVLFERKQTKDGDEAGHGHLLFAQLKLGDKVMKVYRYTDKGGNSDYYNEKGESVRKALLRTPINGAKITSGFGMRNHPILGYTKMHRGVDFGAPTGTPIYAAGDGTVSFAGTKGGYGNYVMIKHDGKFSTAYAHVSRFASGMAAGKKVKQGQIIAYVGSTGASTGPHLHYEIHQNNAQVNPAGVKFKTGNVLAGKELAAFKQKVTQLQAQLESTPSVKTRVAMAQ